MLNRRCVPCEGGIPAISKSRAIKYLKNLKAWRLSGNAKSIYAEYVMKNFIAAIKFIQKIAGLAEKEGHHPDIHLTGYRKLRIELSTHAIGNLSENDFILAAKIDALPKNLKKAAIS